MPDRCLAERSTRGRVGCSAAGSAVRLGPAGAGIYGRPVAQIVLPTGAVRRGRTLPAWDLTIGCVDSDEGTLNVDQDGSAAWPPTTPRLGINHRTRTSRWTRRRSAGWLPPTHARLLPGTGAPTPQGGRAAPNHARGLERTRVTRAVRAWSRAGALRAEADVLDTVSAARRVAGLTGSRRARIAQEISNGATASAVALIAVATGIGN
jgi:hypothetical protein